MSPSVFIKAKQFLNLFPLVFCTWLNISKRLLADITWPGVCRGFILDFLLYFSNEVGQGLTHMNHKWNQLLGILWPVWCGAELSPPCSAPHTCDHLKWLFWKRGRGRAKFFKKEETFSLVIGDFLLCCHCTNSPTSENGTVVLK